MNRIKALLAMMATVCMFVVSVLIIVFQGFGVTDNMSEANVPLYLEPAGYAFIIWQFIYIGYIALGLFQFGKNRHDMPKYVAARPYIIANSACNALWFLGVSQNQYWLTVLCMLGMLYTLATLSVLFRLGKENTDAQEKLFVVIPLTLYYAWITMATPINITSWLLFEVGWQVGTFNSNIWSATLLLAAVFLVVFLYQKRLVNGLFVLVAVWALVAIAVKNIFINNYFLVFGAALGALGLLILVLIESRKRTFVFI